MLIPNNEMTRSLCAWIDKNLHSRKRDFTSPGSDQARKLEFLETSK